MNVLATLGFAAALACAAGAQAQGRWEEPGRKELFPKNFGYKDDRPALFPRNYGYRHREPAPAERWRNPYAGGDRRETDGGYRYKGSGGSDVTGFRREPLGGGSWMDRVR